MIKPDDIHPAIKTSCDGISVLNKVGIDPEYIRCSTKHADLISIISAYWDKSAFNPVKAHVYEHQNDLISPLIITEQLNCDMDELAKEIALDHISSNRPTPIYTIYDGLGTVICHGN